MKKEDRFETDTEEGKEVLTTVTVPQEITVARTWSMLVCAFEGGSNYWARVDEVKLAEGIQRDRDYTYIHEVPLIPGCSLVMGDREEDEEDEDKQKWTLDLDALKKGLQVMAEKYPKHFQNFLDENDDAETGDVYLQCCLMGEIVFG